MFALGCTSKKLNMQSASSIHFKMRIIHRYLGFFLAGVMLVYAVSGIVLIFRDTDFLKQSKVKEEQLAPKLTAEDLGKAIKVKGLTITATQGDVQSFKAGSYNSQTGEVKYTVKKLPFILDKLTHLHKADTNDPLYYLNIFFGVSLLFFVVSAFYMYRPKTTIFKNGIYYTIAGVVLILIMLFV